MSKPKNNTIKSAQAVKFLLNVLPERARDVIERRYGLVGKDAEGMTLEAIGSIYGITRERVRQIENFAIETIRGSEAYTKAKPVFDELEDHFVAKGGVVKEESLVEGLAGDKLSRNQIIFLLNICDSFVRLKEDDHLHHRWTVNEETAAGIGEALKSLHKSLSYEDLISEAEMLEQFASHLRKHASEQADSEHINKWLSLSRLISSNPLGEWGLADSPSIKTRGVRDYAYLVMRKHGKPLHFTEVAEKIEEMFDRQAHVATCHNELIKDERFVLVGRGLYALSEWGYTNGVVRDVIKSVLKKGALSKDDIIEQVLKQREVKQNTIYVNLQNQKYFKKDEKGRYSLVS